MGFTNQERINQFTKALSANVIDANSIAVWYETFFPFAFTLDQSSVWTQLSTVRQYPAANRTTARANAAGPLAGIVQDLSLPTAAVRLTPVAGTNNSTYAAYSTYGDPSSALLGNWLLPQLVPQTSGAPSNGYAIELYDGDPNAGGVLVPTTAGTTGTGVNKTVGWIYNYAIGLLFLSDDFKASVSDPWIVGFRYIGATAGSGGGVVQGVAEESFVDTDFTWANPLSTVSVAETVDTNTDIVGIAKLTRNGVADQKRVSGVPAAANEWRLTAGGVLQVYGDVTAEGDDWVLTYPMVP